MLTWTIARQQVGGGGNEEAEGRLAAFSSFLRLFPLATYKARATNVALAFQVLIRALRKTTFHSLSFASTH